MALLLCSLVPHLYDIEFPLSLTMVQRLGKEAQDCELDYSRASLSMNFLLSLKQRLSNKSNILLKRLKEIPLLV